MQLSQYLWIITASCSWNRASVVATAEHITQNPGDFFVLASTGLVLNGFCTAYAARIGLYGLQHPRERDLTEARPALHFAPL
jgi:hypothetical protein